MTFDMLRPLTQLLMRPYKPNKPPSKIVAIVAPWLPCSDTPWVKEPRVGNGGFTLMKVESVLKVLHNRYRKEPPSYWLDMLIRNSARLRLLFRILERLQRLFPRSRLINRPL